MNLRKQRVRWFSHDRFGVFIHWGCIPYLEGERDIAAMTKSPRMNMGVMQSFLIPVTRIIGR